MKKFQKFLLLSFLLITAVALTMSGPASAATIALWNYNDQNTTVDQGAGTQSFYASAGANPTSTFVLLPATTPVNVPNNNSDIGSPDYAFRINYADIYDRYSGVTWAVSTAGYTDIILNLDLFRSTTSTPIYYRLYISENGGSNWTTAGDRIAFNDTNGWHNAQTYNLSTIFPSLANDNADFLVGLFEDGLPTSSMTSAYTIIDYVTFSGTPVPIPAAAWLLGSGLVGLVVIKRRKKF